MPDYVANTLHQHGHRSPKHPVNSPSKFQYPRKIDKLKLTPVPDNSTPLSPKQEDLYIWDMKPTTIITSMHPYTVRAK